MIADWDDYSPRDCSGDNQLRHDWSANKTETTCDVCGAVWPTVPVAAAPAQVEMFTRRTP